MSPRYTYTLAAVNNAQLNFIGCLLPINRNSADLVRCPVLEQSGADDEVVKIAEVYQPFTFVVTVTTTFIKFLSKLLSETISCVSLFTKIIFFSAVKILWETGSKVSSVFYAETVSNRSTRNSHLLPLGFRECTKRVAQVEKEYFPESRHFAWFISLEFSLKLQMVDILGPSITLKVLRVMKTLRHYYHWWPMKNQKCGTIGIKQPEDLLS